MTQAGDRWPISLLMSAGRIDCARTSGRLVPTVPANHGDRHREDAVLLVIGPPYCRILILRIIRTATVMTLRRDRRV